MNKFTSWFKENSAGDDLVAAYQERLMRLFIVVFSVIFLPLMVFNFRRGQLVLAAGLAFLLVILLLNAAAIHYRKKLSTAKTLLIVGLAAVVGIALESRGVQGTYWAFPIVIFICFSVSLKRAKIYTALFFVYVAALSFHLLDFSVALRAVAGLFLTILFMNIFLGLIEKFQEEMVEQSLRDPLTGTYNRRQMQVSLEEALERKRRNQTPATLLLIDIDDFKNINDTYGHAAGDHVLKKFVALVSGRTRGLDQLFRIGGEEFMLLLPDTSATSALVLAEEMCSLVSQANFIENDSVTISIGLSELETGESIDDWIKTSDSALYRAKENGRNQVFSRMKPTSCEVSVAEKNRPIIKDVVQKACPG